MNRRLSLGSVLVGGLLLAACSSGTSGSGTTTTASAPASTTTVPATTSSPPSKPHVGTALTVPYPDGTASVTLVQVINPAQAADGLTPTAGNQYSGIELKVTNTGSTTFEPNPVNAATAIDSQSHGYQPGIAPLTGCPAMQNLTSLAPGDSMDGCIPFEVPLVQPSSACSTCRCRRLRARRSSGRFLDDGGDDLVCGLEWPPYGPECWVGGDTAMTGPRCPPRAA